MKVWKITGTLLSLLVATAAWANPSGHELNFDVSRTFYLNGDMGRKIINLTPYAPNAQAAAQAADTGEFASLAAAYSPEVLDRYVDGFRVIDGFNFEVGGGLFGSWWYADEPASTLMPYVGIIPFKNRRMITDRFAATRAAIDKLPRAAVPYEAKSLQEWTPHDSLTFASSGGVLFLAGIGAGGVGIGPSFVAMGTWALYVQKLDNNRVFLKITKGSLRSLMTTVGTALVNSGIGEFKSWDEGFSFIYDLNTTDGIHAYEDAVKGNLLLSQKLVKLQNSSVVQDFSFRVSRVGKSSYFWLGIPLLVTVSAGSSMVQTTEHTVYHLSGAKEDVSYGVYTDELFTRFFARHNDRLQTFYSTAYRYVDAQGTAFNGFYGNFLWSFENDKAGSRTFARALNELKTSTGIRLNLPFEIPRGESLGYMGVKLKLNIWQPAATALLEKGLSAEARNAMVEAVNAAIEEYFVSTRDPEGLCRQLPGVDNIYHCQETLRTNAINAVLSMKEHFESMDLAIKSGDRGQFARAFAQIGQLALTNQFAFRGFLFALKGTGAEMETVVEGERLSNYKAKAIVQ